MIPCHNIPIKCEIVKNWNLTLSARAPNNLGTYGPCEFKELEEFFKHALDPETVKKYRYKEPVALPGQKVVAIGDIHGDFLAMVSSLYLMDVVDIEGNWKGTTVTHLVITGDWTDRGGRNLKGDNVANHLSHNPREEVDILQYLFALHKAAFTHDGSVVVTLGNHEMSLMGLNYEIKKAASLQQTRRIPPFYGQHFRLDQDEGWGGTINMPNIWSFGNSYMARYFVHYCPLIAQINNFLFMHGDLMYSTLIEHQETFRTIRSINLKANAYLSYTVMSPRVCAKDFQENIMIGYRMITNITDNRTCSKEEDDDKNEDTCTKNLDDLFRYLSLDLNTGGVVVGHSIQKDGIPHKFNGKFWRIDLAISGAFGNQNNDKKIGGIMIKFENKGTTKVTTKVAHEIKDDEVLLDTKLYTNGVLKKNDSKKVKVIPVDRENTRALNEIIFKALSLEEQALVKKAAYDITQKEVHQVGVTHRKHATYATIDGVYSLQNKKNLSFLMPKASLLSLMNTFATNNGLSVDRVIAQYNGYPAKSKCGIPSHQDDEKMFDPNFGITSMQYGSTAILRIWMGAPKKGASIGAATRILSTKYSYTMPAGFLSKANYSICRDAIEHQQNDRHSFTFRVLAEKKT